MFKPNYKMTDKVVSLLTQIAEAKSVIERAKLLPLVELKLRRQALLRMTHSSTAIEGNILNLKEVGALYAKRKINAPKRDIDEVQNYLKAINFIERIVAQKEKISKKTLLKIHQLVSAKNLPKEQSGHYRQVPVYVVSRDFSGRQKIVYTAPNAKKVPVLGESLIKWIAKSEQEKINPVIAAGMAHQEIAAIHPFVDGNGRTARALATLILYQRGYDFRHLFALEDYYNKNRPNYYQAIHLGKNYAERKKADSTSWMEYFVKGFLEEIKNVRDKVVALSRKKVDKKITSQIYLSKEQLLILDFLDVTGRITANDVVDILKCSKRSAQLHLQKLKKIKTIKQINKGPASYYILG